MELIKYGLTALSFFLSISSCSNDEPVTLEKSKEQVTFSAGLETTMTAGTKALATNPTVEAFTNKTFKLLVKDGRITTFLFTVQERTATTTDVKTGTTIDVSTGVASSNGIDPASVALNSPLYWDDLGGKEANLNFFGVYPATASVTNNSTITWSVGENQSSSETTPGANPNDLLLAYRPAYAYPDKSVAANLNFNHVLTKITLVVKKGINFTTEFKPEAKLVDLPTQGTVNIQPAATAPFYPFTTTTNSATITPTKAKDTAGDTYTYTAIVLPNTLSKDQVFAQIVIGNNTYNIVPGKEVSLAAGANNVFIVTVNKSDVAVSATVTGWTDIPTTTVEKQLITPVVTAIDDNVIIAGSRLYLTLMDNKTPANTYHATYKATTENGKLYWKVEGTPLYWDDITFPASLTASAKLNIGTTNKKEDLYEKILSDKITQMQTSISFTGMTHAMSKVVIKIKQGNGTEVIAPSHAVGITDCVILPSFKDCTINGGTVTDATDTNIDVSFEKEETDAQSVKWDIYTTYIKPQNIAAKSPIINIKIGENIYPVTAANDKPFKFEANKSNIFSITIKKSGVAASATVTKWEDVTNDGITTDLGGSTVTPKP
ncbi:MAG: fimbrillin family protein [Tannerellaceae bacterium]